MKIGLLTYYGDLNCGTNMQAYAALKALRDTFPKDYVEVIPFHGFNPPGKHPYLHHCTINSLAKDVVRIRKYNKFVKDKLGIKHDVIIKDAQKALSYIQQQDYDRIYVGADTLLELDRTSIFNQLSAYWLSPEITAKKYFLAASAKNTTYENLSEERRKLMKETLNGFSGYGVRDINTEKLIQHFIEPSKISLIPDPTFSLDIDYSYVESYLSKKKLQIPSRAVLFHTNKEDLWAGKVATELISNGYKIYSLRPYHWADVVLNDMSPLEQLGIYKYFDFVITHRFHDAIFCLKNMTPLFLYPPKGFGTGGTGNSKFIDLLESFGLLDECFIANPDVNLVTLVEKMKQEFYLHIEKITEKLIANSNLFIQYIKDEK